MSGDHDFGRGRGRGRVLAMLLLIAGCGYPKVSLEPPQSPLSARSYSSVYNRYTRHGRVINKTELDTVLIVVATLRAPQFQSAFLARYLDAYQIGTQAEKERVRKQEEMWERDGLTFLVRAAAHYYKWADLISLHEMWRVVLLTDTGKEISPIRIDPVTSRQPLEAELYGGDLLGPYTRTYNIQFPKADVDGVPILLGAKSLTLRIAGAHGKTDLVWTLK